MGFWTIVFGIYGGGEEEVVVYSYTRIGVLRGADKTIGVIPGASKTNGTLTGNDS